MVQGVKRDPSTDISYSSLAADKRHWGSKGFATSKSDRFAAHGFTAVHAFQSKSKLDVIYDAKKGIADEMHSETLKNVSSMRSKQNKMVDINTMRCGDPRTANNKTAFPYAKPLGPGSYFGQERKKQSMRLLDPERASACFTSLPRQAEQTKSGPDSYDVLQRDRDQWLAKGFNTTSSDRFRPLNVINDKGNNRSMCNVGGLHSMAQKGRVPAFDAQYDTDTGCHKTISRQVQEGNTKFSNAFRSRDPRFANVPSWSSQDSRIRTANKQCDEWIGPGTYDAPSATIGTHNVHTSTAVGMFDSTFRGSPRFRSPGSQSPNQDSSLMKTW